MTDARTWLDQVDARTNAATDGPWKVDGLDREGQYVTRPRDLDEWPEASMFFVTSKGSIEEDAEFIAAARTDLPAATKKLRAVLDLHAPRPYDTIRDGVTFGQADYPDLCRECRSTYPCPTITALEDA